MEFGLELSSDDESLITLLGLFLFGFQLGNIPLGLLAVFAAPEAVPLRNACDDT